MTRAERRRRSATMLAALAMLLAATGLLVGCHHEEVDTPAAVPQVVVIRPQRGEATRAITLPGDVVGYYQSALYAKGTGYSKGILVDKVARGAKCDVLAESKVP